MAASSSKFVAADAVKVVVEHMGLDVSLMNVLRHALYADIPVLAIDTVAFEGYNGPLETETIAHHFGYMPIRWNAAGDVPPPGAMAVFTVNAKADPEGTRVRWVTSEEAVCTRHVVDQPDGQVTAAAVLAAGPGDPRPVSYRTAEEAALAKYDNGYKLCPLLPGQELRARAVAVTGTARSKGVGASSGCPSEPRWCAAGGAIQVRELGSVPRRPETGFAPTCPAGYQFTFSTTGAVDPKKAYIAALRAVEQRLRALSRG
jgi:DNA-directed RNA polymerase subunit L